MHSNRATLTIAITFTTLSALATVACVQVGKGLQVQLGPRPYYLVEKMEESELKSTLQECSGITNFKKTDFSIGHRGAPLQFPEHTKESYVAAARMGAGILECDVTFTKDGELVCRHAQCDLHTTTNIVATDLASKCSVPPDFNETKPFENVECCASDLTLDEFKSLCGKMDASNPNATTVEEYLDGTANWRTDLHSTCGTLLSHKESIELFKSLDAKMTPELKAGKKEDVKDVFGSQDAYAQKMINEYKEASVNPSNVFAQSFNLGDVLCWIENEPAFGKQAIFLDGSPIPRSNPGPFLEDLADQGVNIVAPPLPMLLTLDGNNNIVPSDYTTAAKEAGLDIITWTTERSGRIIEDVLQGGNTYYYQTTLGGLSNDGDILTTIDVLARQVGVLGIFSDWSATTTFYANCMDLGTDDDDDNDNESEND